MLLDVRAWLEAEGFGQYAALFESREIDGDALPLLTDAHLAEMGIAIGPRVKLLAAIARLGAGTSAFVERRRLTVMFVDLVGSTALAGRLDPEELRDLIRDYQQAITSEIARFDAHVARYLGDGALVYFGYPKANEDDAERAVRAAIAITRAVGKLRTPAGEPLAVHIGIATGLVVVGDLLGAGAARERAVVGETPNVAARLQALAGPGEIVVSPQTRALTGNLFDWRELGPQSLKGVAGEIAAFAVVGERPVETRFEAHRGDKLIPMIGREVELDILLKRWSRACEGRGQAVLLTGEAGIGKSRLLSALEEAMAGQPHVRIRNQCSPYHTESALHPMIQQLVRAARIDRAESAAVRLERLQALLRTADATEAGLIGALVGLEGATVGPSQLTPEQQRARTFDALLNQLLRLSQRHPVLWILEDAHWIDPTTLELVTLCIERIAGSRILGVLTARPDFTADFGDAAHVTRLALRRLGRQQVAAMIGELVHGKSLPQPLLAEIAEKTDGVPLFVEELTRTVLEAGILRETDGAYVLDGAPHGLSVPASLHDSMMARLDRHAALKEVAQTAACIGREFDHRLLAEVCGMTADGLAEGLTRLEEAQLVFRRGAGRERQYVFKHALVRDAAYESLLRSKRQEIHARILRALERTPEPPPELLAQHAAAAGLGERAMDYWQRAGALAMARPAYREAIAHFNQALSIAEALPDTRAMQGRRLDLLLLLGQATIPLRGYSHSDTVSVFVRAQDHMASMSDAPHRFSVSAAMWVAYYVRGEHGKALAIARDMVRRAQSDGSDGRMLTALRALGIGQMITGELRAADATFEEAAIVAGRVRQQSREQRMAVAQRFAAAPDIATQFHVGLTLYALGHVDRARKLVDEAMAEARAMGHVHTLGHALAHGAIFAAVLRDAGEAQRLSAETVAFAEEHDMDLWRGYGAIVQAYALVLAGDPEPAIPVMERGFTHLGRTQTGAMVPSYHAVHAYALAATGRFEAAAREATIVEAELRSGLDRYFWTESLRWLGEYRRLLPGARRAAVEECFSQALTVARGQGARTFELGAATSLATYWVDCGEPERAWRLLAPLNAAFDEGADTPVARAATRLLARLPAGGVPAEATAVRTTPAERS